MPNDAPSPKSALALLRFEVIRHLKTLRQEGIPLAECLRSASSRPWPEPGGNYYSCRTLETWWYDYAKSGYTGLTGKSSRRDAGTSRSIDPQTGAWILMKIRENPNAPLQVLHRHWQGHGHNPPSISSIRRFLKAHGHDRRTLRAGRLESGPQKAFEAPAPNDLWMVDFATGPALRAAEGKAIATQLCVILDDHSRLITHAAYYLTGDTAAFLHSLKQAVLRRGLPHKLYTDQGKPFVSHHTRIVCANLGIRLLHAKPYHAWSKGKVERLIRTIQQDFEATLRLENQGVHSLEELNTALSRWIETILAGDEYLLGSLRLSVQRALFTRISATAVLAPLARQDIAPYLNWQVSRAGLQRDIFEPAAIDLLAEASQGNPRTLNLLAQAAWLAAARGAATTIHPDHVHSVLSQVPAATAKTTKP